MMTQVHMLGKCREVLPSHKLHAATFSHRVTRAGRLCGGARPVAGHLVHRGLTNPLVRRGVLPKLSPDPPTLTGSFSRCAMLTSA